MTTLSSSPTRKIFQGDRKPLKDLCVSITDCHHSTPAWTSSGKLVIRNFNVKNGRLDLSKASYTTEEDYKSRISREKPEPGDLVISREAPMGEVCMIPDGVECCLGQRMVLIKPNKLKIDGNYLLYAMLSEFVQKQIFKSDKTGSTVSNLRIPDLKDLDIPLVENESAVAHVLSQLDHKIHLNNKINSSLEMMIFSLYSYWMHQFEFPNEEGKPYRSSNGKFTYNELLKMEIPVDWSVRPMAELFLFKKGVEPGSSEYADTKKSETHIEFYRVSDIKGTTSTYIDQENKVFPTAIPGDVVVTFDGSVGKIGTTINGVYSGGLRKIFDKSGKFNNALVYALMNDQRVLATITKYSTGSILLHASGSIKHLYVPFNEDVYKDFQLLIQPFYKKLVINKIENQKLAELRDWLLPMLINGQAKISNERL